MTTKNIKAQHTPAPWVVGYEPSIPNADIEIRADGKRFAVAHALTVDSDEGGPEVRLANARLIAAAPEMYAALKRLLPALEGRGFSPTEDDITAVLAAIAVIEKAEGGAA